jgi:hypothetical protein
MLGILGRWFLFFKLSLPAWFCAARGWRRREGGDGVLKLHRGLTFDFPF